MADREVAKRAQGAGTGLVCLAPLIGIGIGIAAAPFFAYKLLPDEWSDSWQALWFPRGAGLTLSLCLWCLFVIVGRQKRLHCGGTEDIRDNNDWTTHYLYLLLFGILYSGVMISYLSGATSLFLLLTTTTITAVLGVVGWNSPVALVKKVF